MDDAVLEAHPFDAKSASWPNDKAICQRAYDLFCDWRKIDSKAVVGQHRTANAPDKEKWASPRPDFRTISRAGPRGRCSTRTDTWAGSGKGIVTVTRSRLLRLRGLAGKTGNVAQSTSPHYFHGSLGFSRPRAMFAHSGSWFLCRTVEGCVIHERGVV